MKRNSEGLTFTEWWLAAVHGVPFFARVPKARARRAWLAGEDPTEYCALSQKSIDGPVGPWRVRYVVGPAGDCGWGLVHPYKRVVFIGKVRTKGPNYYDKAVELCAQRNAKERSR